MVRNTVPSAVRLACLLIAAWLLVAHAAPVGATCIFKTPLVPKYAQCTAPNDTQLGSGLSACRPPVPLSPLRVVHWWDAGCVTIRPRSHDGNLDLKIITKMTGLLQSDGVTPYSGPLTLQVPVRITDSRCTSQPCTAVDYTVQMPLTAAGGNVGATAFFDVLAGVNLVEPLVGQWIEYGQVVVRDGSGNLFLVQGQGIN